MRGEEKLEWQRLGFPLVDQPYREKWPFSHKGLRYMYAHYLQFQLGYIPYVCHTHFTYIYMKIMLNFALRAHHCVASYTKIMDISLRYKHNYDLSLTSGKLCRLLKVTILGAAARER